jgi:hypothetical protein
MVHMRRNRTVVLVRPVILVGARSVRLGVASRLAEPSRSGAVRRPRRHVRELDNRARGRRHPGQVRMQLRSARLRARASSQSAAREAPSRRSAAEPP